MRSAPPTPFPKPRGPTRPDEARRGPTRPDEQLRCSTCGAARRSTAQRGETHKPTRSTTCVWLHWASASGPDQLSTGVPPTCDATSPIGTSPPSCANRLRPKYQQTAEKGVVNSPWHTLSADGMNQSWFSACEMKRMWG